MDLFANAKIVFGGVNIISSRTFNLPSSGKIYFTEAILEPFRAGPITDRSPIDDRIYILYFIFVHSVVPRPNTVFDDRCAVAVENTVVVIDIHYLESPSLFLLFCGRSRDDTRARASVHAYTKNVIEFRRPKTARTPLRSIVR